MKRHYLTFEKSLKDLDFEIEKLTKNESDNNKLNDLVNERIKLEKEIFSQLTSWETVQLARHPNRPYTLDYINAWCDNFTELHGDKAFSDDNAVIAGIGIIDHMKVAIIGQQKGRNTKSCCNRTRFYTASDIATCSSKRRNGQCEVTGCFRFGAEVERH